MIEVNVDGSIYTGRLMNLSAQEKIYRSPDGKAYHQNYGYIIDIMDANGVILHINISSLDKITYLE